MSLDHATEEDGNKVQICENSWKSAQSDFSCKNANNTLMYEGSVSHCSEVIVFLNIFIQHLSHLTLGSPMISQEDNILPLVISLSLSESLSPGQVSGHHWGSEYGIS